LLAGKKVAAVITDGFHNTELTDPMTALVNAGAEVIVIGAKPEHLAVGVLDHVGAKLPDSLKPNERLKANRLVDEVKSEEFDALLIPGGYSPEALRLVPAAVKLVTDIYAENKPIAAICHGVLLMISADIVKGKNMTCVSSVAVDLKNAGAIYLDRPFVIHGNIISSRTPADMEYFITGFINVLNG